MVPPPPTGLPLSPYVSPTSAAQPWVPSRTQVEVVLAAPEGGEHGPPGEWRPNTALTLVSMAALAGGDVHVHLFAHGEEVSARPAAGARPLVWAFRHS